MAKVMPIEDQLVAQALDIAARMERLADEGEWSDLADLSAHLRETVAAVPDDEKPALLTQLIRSNLELEATVRRARSDLEQQLSALRVGRNAARAYQSTNDMTGSR